MDGTNLKSLPFLKRWPRHDNHLFSQTQIQIQNDLRRLLGFGICGRETLILLRFQSETSGRFQVPPVYC